MIHIAIPLGYQRRQLAQTLAVPQLEDEQSAPRVNLIASAGFDEPHSFIRVPAEVLLDKLSNFMRESISTPGEINDQTLQVSAEAVEDYIRESQQQKRRDQRNAAAFPHHTRRCQGSRRSDRRAGDGLDRASTVSGRWRR